MKIKLILLFALLLSVSILAAGPTAKVVNVSSTLNIRERPTTNSLVSGKLAVGDTVEILSQDGQWTYVCYGNTLGYVKSSYLQPIEDVKETTISNKEEKSYSSYRWKIVFIVLLAMSAMQLFISDNFKFGIIIMAVLYALELWYLKADSPAWFVTPFQVGWGWTLFNGFWFLMFMMLQYGAMHCMLSYFGTSGVISDWAFRICIVMSLMDTGFGTVGALCAVIVVLIISLISNFSLRGTLYALLGSALWFIMFYLFGQIIKEFHDFFVWTLVLFIIGSVPVSSSTLVGESKNMKGDENKEIDFFDKDSGELLNLKDEGGGIHRDNHGRRWVQTLSGGFERKPD